MKISRYITYDKTPTVLCLGGFDSIHKGHRKIINSALAYAKSNSLNLAVMTFSDNSDIIDKFKKVVFTFEERLDILKSLFVDEVIYVDFNKEFADKKPLDFLNEIVDNRLIAALFCGKDYTFGSQKRGNITFLDSFCKGKNIPLYIIDFENDLNGEKISTAAIKQALTAGNIERANELLSCDYFVNGVVLHGRQVGRTIGFPTANVQISSQKCALMQGVYHTQVVVDGKKYQAITNYGKAPTFGVDKILLESHLVDFNRDLYGKNITICFKSFIRGIKKFKDKNQLIEQLQQDLKVIK